MNNITAIVEMLSKEVEQELGEEITLTEIERVTRRMVQELGRQTVTAVVNGQEEQYPEAEITCPKCRHRIGVRATAAGEVANDIWEYVGKAGLLSMRGLSSGMLSCGPPVGITTQCSEC